MTTSDLPGSAAPLAFLWAARRFSLAARQLPSRILTGYPGSQGSGLKPSASSISDKSAEVSLSKARDTFNSTFLSFSYSAETVAPVGSGRFWWAAWTEGWIFSTTLSISSQTVENSSSRVYCSCAFSRNIRSSRRAEKQRSSRPCRRQDKGVFWRNISSIQVGLCYKSIIIDDTVY